MKTNDDEIVRLEASIDKLRGQLQNCVNHLNRLKRHGHASDVQACDKCIESANKALYESLIREDIVKPEERIKVDEDKRYVIKCKCGNKPATEPHSCPFASEISSNDDPEYCTCCEDCEHDCAMDI